MVDLVKQTKTVDYASTVKTLFSPSENKAAFEFHPTQNKD